MNLDALGDYLFAESDYDTVSGVSSDEKVHQSSEQMWLHLEGCEYLAANPLFVPRLTPILRDAIQQDPTFDPRGGVFDVPDFHGEPDAFDVLPMELRLYTLSYLNSRDIANLRSASRTFRQLPNLLWRDLLLKEMPWLWEVWSDEKPYHWATIKYEDAEDQGKECSEFYAWHGSTRQILEEEMPEVLDAWEEEVEEIKAQRDREIEAAQQAKTREQLVTGLPPTQTNWYKLYTEITRNWKDLKGLQNRKRIWKDIERMMPELDKYMVDEECSISVDLEQDE